MFGLGLPELFVICAIALLVFGPKKLPDLGKSIGRAMAEFKKASQEFQDSLQEEVKTARIDAAETIGHAVAGREQLVPRGVPGNEQPEIRSPDGDAEKTNPGAPS